jgi:hypothetical protein
MNNATVSDTEVSFAASLYEAFRRYSRCCSNFAMSELSDQKVQAIGAARMDERHTLFCTLPTTRPTLYAEWTDI